MSPGAGTPRPLRDALRIPVVVALLAGLAACSRPSGSDEPRALHELERMAFVPAGAAYLDAYVGALADVSLKRPLLIDVYELSRRDVLALAERHASLSAARRVDALRPSTREQDEGTLDWPAPLTWYEAREIAEVRGMRLPRAREWLHVAVGARSYPFPWGNFFQASVANTLELGLLRPAPVGTFENGRSRPFGCYDLLGNVWEWVEDRVPGYQDELSSRVLPLDELASVLGGGFEARARFLYDPDTQRFLARTVDRGHLSPAVGARMVADAETYLRRFAPTWGTGQRARMRIEAVAFRWGEAVGHDGVATFLAALAREEGAPEQLAWLAAGARSRR